MSIGIASSTDMVSWQLEEFEFPVPRPKRVAAGMEKQRSVLDSSPEEEIVIPKPLPSKEAAASQEEQVSVQAFLLKAHWCLLKDRVAVLAAVGALQRLATKILGTPCSKHSIDEKSNTAKVLAA